ncbi:MAG: hypothetical protein AAF670_03880 [Planctomycetota bacterium]
MKRRLKTILVAATLLAGCDGSASPNKDDPLSQSELQNYSEMMADSNSLMLESDAASAELDLDSEENALEEPGATDSVDFSAVAR